MNVYFRKLKPNATAPAYRSIGAAGADLRACFADQDTQCYIAPGMQVTIPTGIAVCVPYGMIGLVIACDDLGCKSGLVPANKVGVICENYHDEIVVCLRNQSEYVHRIVNGDRIAQVIFVPYEQGEFVCISNEGHCLS